MTVIYFYQISKVVFFLFFGVLFCFGVFFNKMSLISEFNTNLGMPMICAWTKFSSDIRLVTGSDKAWMLNYFLIQYFNVLKGQSKLVMYAR